MKKILIGWRACRAIVFVLVFVFVPTSAQVSPNGKIKASISHQNTIKVEYKNHGKWLHIFTMESNVFTMSQPQHKAIEYNMLTGKRHHCTNAYNESTYYADDSKPILSLRVYNDGIAVKGAMGTISLENADNNWLQRWTDSYEEFFPKNRIVKENQRFAYPALFEYETAKQSVFVLISESNIHSNESGSSMYAVGSKNRFNILPDGDVGGWQTFIIGSLVDVVSSTLITDNSDASTMTDVSWIQPGVASWVYWAYNHGSNDFNIIKKYVDFAATLKLKYVLIDAEWDDMKDGKTVVDAVRYAIGKGVKPMIWYNSSVGWVNGAPGPKYRLNKPEDREKEFAWCESIGVAGVKIDFFSGDTNMNMAYMIDLLKCAAKHHLLVNFHGATIPRGWQRTYPNLMSTEGVYGAEWYNNVPTFTPIAASHNAMLPFTRNVVGPMDYTPCAFSDSQHPHITTHAHELALTALYESGIQHLADKPESFLAQPQLVKDYLTNLPAAWDDTRLLAGYPGEYAVIARRKGEVWYIAGINGTDKEKTININTKPLGITAQSVRIFEDSNLSSSPWRITDTTKVPQIFTCQPRGGFLLVVE